MKPVLEVGSGKNPHLDADVLVDLFPVDTPGHRHFTSITIDRPFVQADVQDLPFRDKVFSFVHCYYLLEHVEDPVRACAELSRVADAGCISVPTKIYEYLHPTKNHKWFCTFKNGTLYFERKPKNWRSPFGNLFNELYYKGWARIVREYPHVCFYKINWTGSISARTTCFKRLSMKEYDLDRMMIRSRSWKNHVPLRVLYWASYGGWYQFIKSFLHRVLKRGKKIDVRELLDSKRFIVVPCTFERGWQEAVRRGK